MIGRADVVIARFPYAGGQGHKVRPAVVVQCDRLNQQIQNTLLAMITGNTRLVGSEPTLDPQTALYVAYRGRLVAARELPSPTVWRARERKIGQFGIAKTRQGQQWEAASDDNHPDSRH